MRNKASCFLRCAYYAADIYQPGVILQLEFESRVRTCAYTDAFSPFCREKFTPTICPSALAVLCIPRESYGHLHNTAIGRPNASRLRDGLRKSLERSIFPPLRLSQRGGSRRGHPRPRNRKSSPLRPICISCFLSISLCLSRRNARTPKFWCFETTRGTTKGLLNLFVPSWMRSGDARRFVAVARVLTER